MDFVVQTRIENDETIQLYYRDTTKLNLNSQPITRQEHNDDNVLNFSFI